MLSSEHRSCTEPVRPADRAADERSAAGCSGARAPARASLGSGAAAALAAPARRRLGRRRRASDRALARGDAAVGAPGDSIRSDQDAARAAEAVSGSRPRSCSRRRGSRRAGASASPRPPTARRRTTCSASRPGWDGKGAVASTTEYVAGAAQKVEKFRAYGSYTEAFQDFGRLIRTARATPACRAGRARTDDPVAATRRACSRPATRPIRTTRTSWSASSTRRCACRKRSREHHLPPQHRLARDDRELRGAADHRQQRRQCEHRRLFAPERRAGDRVQPADRLRLLRQGRRRRDGDARAQRLPHPRGGDDRLARRRRRGAQQPAAAARDGVPDRRGRPRLRGAADVQRLRRRLQQAAGRLGAPGRAGADRRPRRALSRRLGPDRFDPGRHRPGPAHVGRLDQCADDTDRRPQPPHRQRHRNRPHAQRPARPARHGDRRPLEDRPGDDGRRRRRHGRRLPRRRAEARPRRRGDGADGARRSVRSGQGADRHHRRRHDARLPRRLHRRRLGRRPAARAEPRSRRCARPDRPARFGDRRQPQRAAGARPRPRPALRARRAAALGRRRLGGALVEQRAGGRRAGRLVRQRPRRSRLERLDRRRLHQRAAAERLRARRRSDAARRKLPAHPPQRRHGADREQRQRRRRLSHRRRRSGAGAARSLPAPAGVARDAVDRARARRPEGNRRGSAGDGVGGRRQHRHRRVSPRSRR